MTTEWVRIRSWHVVWRILAPQLITACGRRLGDNPVVVDTPPANQKTCELCLRWLARKAEAEEG